MGMMTDDKYGATIHDVVAALGNLIYETGDCFAGLNKRTQHSMPQHSTAATVTHHKTHVFITWRRHFLRAQWWVVCFNFNLTFAQAAATNRIHILMFHLQLDHPQEWACWQSFLSPVGRGYDDAQPLQLRASTSTVHVICETLQNAVIPTCRQGRHIHSCNDHGLGIMTTSKDQVKVDYWMQT
jgi:hypothetical protein